MEFSTAQMMDIIIAFLTANRPPTGPISCIFVLYLLLESFELCRALCQNNFVHM